MIKIVAAFVLTVVAFGQTSGPAAKASASAAKPKGAIQPAAASIVDTVIELKVAGASDAEIITALQGENKPHVVTLAETLKLKKANVSAAVVSAIGDPKGAAVGVSAGAPPTITGKPVAEPAAVSRPATATGEATSFPPNLSSTSALRKRRLAVKAFDYSTVKTWVNYWFNQDYNIGDGIRAMLVTRMHQSKNITLLEREKLDVIQGEIALNSTSAVNQGQKSRRGRFLGADCMLLGDIVIFGRDDKSSRTGGAVSTWTKYLPKGSIGGAVFTKEEKAVVGINLRIVDVETGEVIETTEARGESSRKSRDYSGLTGGRGAVALGGQGLNSSNFEQTIIGEATSNAVDKVVAFLEGKVPSLPVKPREIEGRIANITPSATYLSVGEVNGVARGDRFEILQVTDEVHDPATKELIDYVTTKVGEVVVSDVRDKSATGTYGGQPITQEYAAIPAKGYIARLMSK
ncbi:MAG: CsgG/HfaB family protein [Bryobacteraceae bacterium]